MELTSALMRKRSWLHFFGVLSLFLVAHFWIAYFVFGRSNNPADFNAFLAQYSFVGAHALEALFAAILAAGLAAFANKLWWLVSLLALTTIVFLYSQVT